ncbi:hypothetical protein V6N12_007752 [Hibiscus sabdariffa]|uniref:Mitochondrial protein n=1 Tax=Hibiscus sabdariffa TaxID=183260 RepID=A0ABR2F2P9_9ROSI
MYLLNLVSWNVRGLGKVEKQRAVKNLVKKFWVNFLFIQETKLEIVESKTAKFIGGSCIDQFWFVHAIGSAGGITSFWDSNFFHIERQVLHKSYVLLVGFVQCLKRSCGFINLYTPNDASERKSVFAELENLIKSENLIWILGGDFNSVRGQDEKIGFSFNASSSEVLNDFIEETSLFDLPLSGSRFTWSNARDHGIFCRLDRVFVSPELLHILPGISLQVLPKTISYHNLIQVSVRSFVAGPRPFKIFNHWMDDKTFNRMLRSSIKVLRGFEIGNILYFSKRVAKAWVEKERKISIRALIEEAEKKIEALEALIQIGRERNEGGGYMHVSTASVLVLINGSPSERFSLKRGLRQGCPLSPMLFNLVAEGLSLVISKAANRGFFEGVKLGADSLEITHLRFADDLLIFCETVSGSAVGVHKEFSLTLEAGCRETQKKARAFESKDHVFRREGDPR